MRRDFAIGIVAVLSFLPCPVLACSLCGGLQSQTLRQDAAGAALVLYGTLTNPRLNGPNDAGAGTTDLVIEKVIKASPFLGDRKVLVLPRYVPVDPKNPPRFLIYCDVFKGKDNKERLDPYRGVPVKSDAVVAYLRGSLALDPKDRPRALLHFFNYLDCQDPDVANDAFLEFAKASDQEVGQVAGQLPAAKLRGWLSDPNTPANRLSLYAFLLGACGTDKDAELLRSLLLKPTDRTTNAHDGLLGGYIQLRPREGWDMATALLSGEKTPFIQRFAVLRTLRFFHGWKPEATRAEVVRGLGIAVSKGEVADLAVEDLRRWKYWDLTRDVLAQYGKATHASPIIQRAIVRYALTCPQADAKRFIDDLRRRDPELIKEVEEALEPEKPN